MSKLFLGFSETVVNGCMPNLFLCGPVMDMRHVQGVLSLAQ